MQSISEIIYKHDLGTSEYRMNEDYARIIKSVSRVYNNVSLSLNEIKYNRVLSKLVKLFDNQVSKLINRVCDSKTARLPAFLIEK